MRMAGQALANTAGGVLGGGLAAFGADALVNEPINHIKSLHNIINDSLTNNPELADAFSFVHSEGLSAYEKQSIANVLTGNGRDIDAAVLETAGALERVQELMTKRPDLAENVGYLSQLNNAAVVDQLEQGVSAEELSNSRGAYGLPSLAAGAAAGYAGAYGANALGNRFRRK